MGAVGHLWGPNEERGLFKTTDGGETWENILYIDEHTGIIDLVMDHNDPNTLFAAMYQRQRTGFGFAAGGGGSGLWRTTDGGENWTRLEEGLPEGELGRIGLDIYRRDGNLVYAIVEAHEGQGVYRSTDRGETWEFMSDRNPRPMYFSLIRIDPNNPERIYLGGVQSSASDDGGRTWWPGNATDQIHSDHHALWINPDNSNHLINGNDGGLAFSRDGSVSWRSIRNMAIGQFYEIDVDMSDPYNVCGGLQDNGNWCAPHRTQSTWGVRNREWTHMWFGDGFHNHSDPEDPNIMFSESQGGNMARIDVATREGQSIRPAFDESLGRLIGLAEPFAAVTPDPDPLTETWEELTDARAAMSADMEAFAAEVAASAADWTKGGNGEARDNAALHEAREALHGMAERCRDLTKQIDHATKLASRAVDIAVKELDARDSDLWTNPDITKARKALEGARAGAVEVLRRARYFVRQADWLQERFPDAELRDVEGLVKLVDRAEIEAHDWSLTPGRYVGVAPEEEDEDFDFEEALRSIHVDLTGLNEEATELAARIARNLEELGV